MKLNEGTLVSTEISGMYDKYARYYDIYSILMWLGLHHLFRNFIIKELDLERGDVVLEIGCGTGLNFSRIQKKIGKEGKLIGIDISNKMLDIARKKKKNRGWDNIRLINGDFNNLEDNTIGILKKMRINKVVMMLVVHVIPHYKDVITKSLNFLSRGGKIVIGDLKKLNSRKSANNMYNKLIESSSKKFGQDFKRYPWRFVRELAKKNELANCRYSEKIKIFYSVSGIKL